MSTQSVQTLHLNITMKVQEMDSTISQHPIIQQSQKYSFKFE